MEDAKELRTRNFPSFNGGKMMHVFEFDETTRLYTTRAISSDALEALEKGRLFYKIDGSNGMILKEEADENDGIELRAFQRLDTRGRPPPEHCVPLPNGLNTDSYEGHSYCYEPILADVAGKKARKRNEAMLALVQKHAAYLSSFGDVVSIEWVGKKFNKTPGVPHDVAIAIHEEQIFEEVIQRDYEGLRSFLLDRDPPIEGIIIEFRGTYWKVRADCFDRKCSFKTNTGSAKPPIYLC